MEPPIEVGKIGEVVSFAEVELVPPPPPELLTGILTPEIICGEEQPRESQELNW
jgi:hypothetical protein